jgi:hypothetical protein
LKTANNWWLRSPNLNNTNNVLYVNTSGDWNNNNYNNTYGVRPALVELRGRVTRTTGESRAPTIKGNHILSRPNGGDEHITPRLAHPLRDGSGLPRGSGPVFGMTAAGSFLYQPPQEEEKHDLRGNLQI